MTVQIGESDVRQSTGRLVCVHERWGCGDLRDPRGGSGSRSSLMSRGGSDSVSTLAAVDESRPGAVRLTAGFVLLGVNVIAGPVACTPNGGRC